jgi:hypothetical protein
MESTIMFFIYYNSIMYGAASALKGTGSES